MGEISLTSWTEEKSREKFLLLRKEMTCLLRRGRNTWGEDDLQEILEGDKQGRRLVHRFSRQVAWSVEQTVEDGVKGEVTELLRLKQVGR